MKKLLISFVSALSESLDWLAVEPHVKALMPSEMYTLDEPPNGRRDRNQNA